MDLKLFLPSHRRLRWSASANYYPSNYGANNATQIGLPASLVNQFPEPRRFPYITASNYQTLGESGSNIWFAPSTTLSFAPTLSMIRGRHNIRAGFDFRLMHLGNYQSAFAGGTTGRGALTTVATRYTGLFCDS